jgi:phage-related tail fiber protein
MSKHVTKIAAALVSYSTHAAFAGEAKRECIKLLVTGDYDENDMIRIDREVVVMLATHYKVDYKVAEKNGKLSGLTLPQGGPAVALSRVRSLLQGVQKPEDTRSETQKKRDAVVATFKRLVKADQKAAKKLAEQLLLLAKA